MESKVIFHDGMDNDPADYTALQGYAQRSLDNVVADTITPAQRYAGFAVTKTGPTTIRVAPGRLYSAGHVYARQTEFIKDFVTSLPVAGKKIVAVVAWGQESDTDTRPREFLINEETGASEPRVVAMERARIANVNTAAGAEAPDPTPPLVDVGYTVLAHVLLTPTGVDTVTMLADNEIPNLAGVAAEVDVLETWRQKAEPLISTLSSDLSRIANGIKGNASSDVLARTLVRLAVVEEQAGIPSNAADSDADFFLTADESDLTNPNFLAKVEEGIRFAADAESESVLAIFDPLNPRAMIKNGVMFPAYDREAWLQSGLQAGEAQIAGYSYATHEMVQRTMSRQRIRYGEEFTVCTNNLWWQTGKFDYTSWTFKRAGETFEVLGEVTLDVYGSYAHNVIRLRKVWNDTVTETYWDRVTIDHTVNGAQIAETWLQGQDIWLDAVGLYFTRLAAAGAMNVALCEVSNYGLPDLTKVIAITTLDRAAMKLAPEETVVPITPTYLQAGKRYAIVLTTAADHWVATVPGESFTQGTFFYVLDGAYAQGDGTRDLMFRLHRARFRAARAVIELGGLQLSGGILAIDILADTIIPGSTTLNYEIQVGGIWYPLFAVDQYILGQGGNIPPLLPFRVVFNGSVDMMPAVKLLDSRVRVSRPRTTFRHITMERTLPAPSTQIRVIHRYEYFDGAFHTATCRLLTGAGFATEVTASSTSDVIDPTDGALERTSVFNLGAAVSAYKIDTRGTTTSAQKTFHAAYRKDYAL